MATVTPTQRPTSVAAIPGLPWKLLVGAWTCLTIYWAFLRVGPATGFTLGGHGAKIVFFHVPCAWIATLALLAAAVYATRYLYGRRAGDRDIDLKCETAMELGFLFALLATITGSIFARNEWQTYWNWRDPRMTSILVVLLLFGAYLVLRGALEEPDRRGRLTAAYALLAIVPAIFLIWVLPRILPTLHAGPNESFVKGQISSGFRMVMYGMALPAYIGLFVWLFQLKLRAARLFVRREAGDQV